jgi:hypothetical protein
MDDNTSSHDMKLDGASGILICTRCGKGPVSAKRGLCETRAAQSADAVDASIDVLTRAADLMRSIDAYAYDYYDEGGKLSPSRITVERELRAALAAAKAEPAEAGCAACGTGER